MITLTILKLFLVNLLSCVQKTLRAQYVVYNIHWLKCYMGAHVRIMTQQVSTFNNKVFMIDMISEPIVIKNGVVVSGHL